MSKKLRIRIPLVVRQYVLKRDRCQCQSCGCTGSKATLEVDHIISLQSGGSNDISNLQVLCRHCNQKKMHHLDPRFQRRFNL